MMQSLCCVVFAAAYVYTIGDIGEHRVVSTKLPQIGRDMSSQISSGSNVTRLLGMYNFSAHGHIIPNCFISISTATRLM